MEKMSARLQPPEVAEITHKNTRESHDFINYQPRCDNNRTHRVKEVMSLQRLKVSEYFVCSTSRRTDAAACAMTASKRYNDADNELSSNKTLSFRVQKRRVHFIVRENDTFNRHNYAKF
ncbi:hypothetical protein EVAR_81652_1 [Eumeta japonica]|uniref:Uncharacterized protein n=1 Tax=Eumeta variegata TaxID=151549 RepID=A0A4C1V4D9_EUMVA|nr:hypothetical protein EVAR_81652_1 [Eumeta japonica]